MLTQEQVEFYKEHGYLRIPQVFTKQEIDAMDVELMNRIESFATDGAGWTGAWRKVYMDVETEKKSKLIALHDLSFYSQAWTNAVTNQKLTAAMADLIGPNVELHHSTLHAKPPETG